ncbi:cold-shock protein [Sphingobacterium phlebotomi]
MLTGAVKWFDNNKGFGVLALPLGEELFVHIRAFKPPPNESIKSGQVIACDKKHDPKRDSYYAHNCHVLSHSDDWKAVLSLLGKDDTVQLEGKQRKGQQHSLMELAANQLLKGKDEDSIFKMVTSDLDRRLASSLFIPYAEFLEKVFVRALAKESSDRLLSRVFGYFGERITPDILFRVWKASKFRYIGYDKPGGYEIPEEVLNVNATEIGYEELARIREHSFG